LVNRQWKDQHGFAAMPFIYYVAHALKLAGGGTGGWLAQRAAIRTSQPVTRVG